MPYEWRCDSDLLKGSTLHDFRTHARRTLAEYTLRTPSLARSKVSCKCEMKACWLRSALNYFD